MEIEIKSLNRKVNFLIVISAIGTLVTLAKMLMLLPAQQSTPSNTNNVQIGDHQPTPQRDYMTSEEVAEKEGVSARTVTYWIEQGRIEPPPTKSDRAWIISANYRILPQLTASKP